MRIVEGLFRLTKVCSKCKVLKPLTAFSKNQCSCKDCAKQYRKENLEVIKARKKEHYKKNKKQISERAKEFRKSNRERINSKKREKYEKNKDEMNAARKERIKNDPEFHKKVKGWKRAGYQKHKERINSEKRKKYAEDESFRELISERGKKYRESWTEEKKRAEKKRLKNFREENKEELKAKAANHYQKNKEKILERTKIYRLKNKEQLSKKANERKKERRKEDPNFKLSESISQHTRIIFSHIKKDKNIRSEKTIKCSIEDLKKRFDGLFTEGMSWDNHGIGDGKWQIDHIVPVSWFVKNMEDRAWLANCYWNLQPMWSIENSKKKDNVNQKSIDDFFLKLEQHENK